MTTTLLHGDCLELMRAMPDDSVDAIVTDPPYGLSAPPDIAAVLRAWLAGDSYEHTGAGFMGKGWDSFVPGPLVWREALRVVKPGGHAVVFAGTRTVDLMGIACRLAGWEVRDCIEWVQFQGFPKSVDLAKSPMFCQCGAVEHSGENTGLVLRPEGRNGRAAASGDDAPPRASARHSTGRVTDSPACCRLGRDSDDEQPRQVQGDDQASPPSLRCAPERSRSGARDGGLDFVPEHTPSLAPRIARHASTDSPPHSAPLPRPLDTAESSSPAGDSPTDSAICAQATRKHGTAVQSSASGFPCCSRCGKPIVTGFHTGLKPAHEPALLLRKPLRESSIARQVLATGTGALNIDGCRYGYGDEAWPGPQENDDTRRPAGITPTNRTAYGTWRADAGEGREHFGGSPLGRFPANLYACPKASRTERERGCEGLPAMTGAEAVGREEGSAGLTPRAGAGRSASEVRNGHPTVKPIRLMRWLCRLVTPPGGVVLDPFMGSGSTGCAAKLEGFGFVGCELDAGYLAIARARIQHAAPGENVAGAEDAPEVPQLGLFGGRP